MAQNAKGSRKLGLVYLLISPVLGFLSFLLPELLSGVMFDFDCCKPYVCFLFINNTFEKLLFSPTIILLGIIGIVSGYISYRLFFLVGPLSVIIFPLNALIEMFIYPSSHNLLFFEIIFYGLFSLPAFTGSFVGYYYRQIRDRIEVSS